jgi:hypothetical protein
MHFVLLDSRLMELLAIRLSWQTTPAKSLVMRGNDGTTVLSGFIKQRQVVPNRHLKMI